MSENTKTSGGLKANKWVRAAIPRTFTALQYRYCLLLVHLQLGDC